MNRLLPLAGCLLAFAMPAAATDYNIALGPNTSSVDFGATGMSSGAIDDSYMFTVSGGSVNGLVGSIALSSLLDINLTEVWLDGVSFDQILSDGTELWTLEPTGVGSGSHVLRVVGVWGSQGGSYAGTLNFSPLPEPGSWLLMLGGMGLAGALMRRGRHQARYSFS